MSTTQRQHANKQTNKKTTYKLVYQNGKSDNKKSKKQAVKDAKTRNRMVEDGSAISPPRAVIRQRERRTDHGWVLEKKTAIAIDEVPSGVDKVYEDFQRASRTVEDTSQDLGTDFLVETSSGEEPVQDYVGESQ